MSSEPSAETLAVTKVLTGEKNERGIPKVVFIVRGGAPPPPPPAAGAPADPARARSSGERRDFVEEAQYQDRCGARGLAAAAQV